MAVVGSAIAFGDVNGEGESSLLIADQDRSLKVGWLLDWMFAAQFMLVLLFCCDVAAAEPHRLASASNAWVFMMKLILISI